MSSPIKYPSNWFLELQGIGRDVKRNVDFLAVSSRPVEGFAVPEYRESFRELCEATAKLYTLLKLDDAAASKKPDA